MAEVVNATPNASIQVPSTSYKMRKFIKSDIEYKFYVQCPNCNDYSSTTSSKCECITCGRTLTTVESNHFVYIPLKQQLIKSIHENFARINSYRLERNKKKDIICDVYDSILYKQAEAKYQNATVLSLSFNTDGANVHKCSSKSLWAIQFYQNFLPPILRYIPKSILVAGLYFGSHKPNMHDFLLPLFQELDLIYKEGGICIEQNGKKYNFIPLVMQCCCDLPAKAEVQSMVNHNGYYSCGYCIHPGKSIKASNSSNSYVRYVRQNIPSELRTHESMLQIYRKIKSDPIMGVKKVSCMIAARDFDIVNGFCIDYMHCVLLGVLAKLLNLWLDSKYHSRPHYINPKLQIVLNRRIVNIKPISNISRKPRSLSEKAKFKANEYRNLLLYYLTFSLDGLLPKKYIEHFRLLSSSIYKLLETKITLDEISEAESKFNLFANQFEDLYGVENVTTNLHLLRHIANSVRYHGPLWAQSAFGFESNNGLLVETKSKKHILHSIAWKYTMRSHLNLMNKTDKKSNIKVQGKQKISISSSEISVLSDFESLIESGQLNIYKSVNINDEKFSSINSREVSTVDYVVKTKYNTIGLVKYFFEYEQTLYAMIDLLNIIEELDQFKLVDVSGKFQAIPFSKIEYKLLYMKIGKKNIVTEIPNNYEKT